MPEHPNSLAIGVFCEVCGTRVGDNTTHGTSVLPCPMGPHEEPS